MRDNAMVDHPPHSLLPESPPSPQTPGQGGSAMLLGSSQYEMGPVQSFLLSLGIHVGIVVVIWLTLLILQFLGINLLTFDRPERIKDIEFQLVTAPEEKPRDPNTRNRAERNTRAGGERVPHLREAESHAQAGTPQPRPTPQPRVAQRPSVQPTPQPPRQQPQPPKQPSPPVMTQAPEPPKPAPPKPRITAPKPSTKVNRIAALPNPLAPIKVPDAPGPVATTGPVVRGPVGGGATSAGSSTSSTSGPATVPGQFSSGGRPSAGGGPSGQGGRSSYSQYGSPGGGGGRPGIDARAEPDFGPYIAELQRRIRRNWTPPDDREDKTVVLVFTISKDGRLMGISTKRSSGVQTADAAARLAVERSAPFRPLPAEYRGNTVSVEFTFDYNVFMGRSSGIRTR